jgi:hypothetical protein
MIVNITMPSFDIVTCDIAFDLQLKEGLDTPVFPHENADFLLILSGKNWHVSEISMSVCGVVLVVRFHHLPSVEEIESVRAILQKKWGGNVNE